MRRSWQFSHICFRMCGVRAIVVGKLQREPLELPLAKKIENQNQYHIPGGKTAISATVKELRETGVVLPPPSPFNASV